MVGDAGKKDPHLNILSINLESKYFLELKKLFLCYDMTCQTRIVFCMFSQFSYFQKMMQNCSLKLTQALLLVKKNLSLLKFPINVVLVE